MNENEALKRAERKFEAVQGMLSAARSQLNDVIQEMSLAMAAMYDAVESAALAAQDTEEPEGIRWFTAAYRARNGNVIAIGVENTMRGEAEHTAEEFRREDPDGPEYFVASRIQPPWLPVEPEGEADER